MSSLKLDRGMRLKKKYIDELEEYKLVCSDVDLLNLSKGVWIRYVNFQDHELLPYRCIYVRSLKRCGKISVILMSTTKKYWTIDFNSNFIYYRTPAKDNNIRDWMINVKKKVDNW